MMKDLIARQGKATRTRAGWRALLVASAFGLSLAAWSPPGLASAPGKAARSAAIGGGQMIAAGNVSLEPGSLAGPPQPGPTTAPPKPMPMPMPPSVAAPKPAASVPVPVTAGVTQPQVEPLTADVMGALMGVVSHEFGNFIIHEEKLPITGSADQMADEFAAMLMIANLQSAPSTAAGPIDAAVKFWADLANNPGDAKAVAWYQQHGPDKARLKALVCLLYGADPTQMTDAAKLVGLTPADQKPCAATEATQRAAWEALLTDHRRRGADPVEPGSLDPKAPGHQISVQYDSPKNPAARKFQTFFLESQVFDQLADIASMVYVLPRDTKLVLRECGEADGAYDPADGSMTVCYETVTAIQQFFLNEGLPSAGPFAAPLPAVAVTAPPTATAPKLPLPPVAVAPTPTPPAVTPVPTPPAPMPPVAVAPTPPTPVPPPVVTAPPGMPQPQVAPPPPAPSQAMTIEQYLVGIWRIDDSTEVGPETVVFQLNGDGSYQAVDAIQTSLGQIKVDIYGRWSVEQSNNQFQLTFAPQQWQPTQWCSRFGQCIPISPSQSTVAFLPVDRNTIRSAKGVVTRLQ
jgi:Putative metallopeptidase